MDELIKVIGVAGLGLILLLSGCAPAAGRGSAAAVAPPAQEDEAYAEALDPACAYFYFLWGQAAEADEQADEALEAYRKALICDPRSEWIMGRLAQLLIGMSRRQEAAELLSALVESRPQAVATWQLLGKLYSAMGKYDQAVQAYEKVLAEDPDNADVFVLLGILHARNREYGKARDILERLVQSQPGSFFGHYYLARLYREMGFTDKAIASYRQALALNRSDRVRLELAELLEQEKRFDEAIEAYREEVADDDGGEEARKRLIGLLLGQKRLDEALEELRVFKDAYGDGIKASLEIGRILLSQKRFPEAVAELSALLESHPENEEAGYFLALAYEETGEKEKAKELLAAIPRSARLYEQARLRLAEISQDQGDLAGAARLLRAEIDGSPEAGLSIFLALASLYEEQEDFEAAEAVLAEAGKRYPAEARVVFAQGILLDKQGDLDGALAMMQEVLELEPDNPFALNYVGYTWADRGINLDQALGYIEQAVQLRPDDGFIRDSLGWVHFQRGDYAKAVAELEKALAIVESDPTIQEHLGDAYGRIHQPEKALQQYRQALEGNGRAEHVQRLRTKIEAIVKELESGRP